MGAKPQNSPSSCPVIPGLVYQSAALQQVAKQIYRIKDNPGIVLLTGESGTGKEVVARALHTLSQRASHPFIAYNCSALDSQLAEAELFGYRKGAFTDAREDSLGVIRAAEGGTLFLDEIGELPTQLQPKLLRFLDRQEVHPLGESQPQIVKVRIVAATNADLLARVPDETFRADLFYRLNVFSIYLPPLRERGTDIGLLLDHFLQLYGQRAGKPNLRLKREARTALLQYPYPGNVRELSSIVQRLVAYNANQQRLSRADLLHCCPELSNSLHEQPAVDWLALPDHFPAEQSLKEIRTTWGEAFERTLIAEALWRHGGNVKRAAADLGWERSTLRNKCKAYQLLPSDT
jgi:hydrogenase-4 transcriptional activator